MTTDSSKQVRDQYDTWHARRAAAREDRTLRPWHRTVLKLLPDLNGLSVLEIGCGSGSFSLLLAARYPEAKITAVDFSERAIEAALDRQRQAGTRIEFMVKDAQRLTFPDGRFDFVFSCECLEHLPEPGRMCQEIARVLKPRGEWILTTENYFNGMVLAWLMSIAKRRHFDSGSGVQPHENFFLFWRVRRMVEQAGLEIRHMESNHFQWLLLPRVAPDKLRTDDFQTPFLRRLLRPFGRHFTFKGTKA
ncbi:MAG: 2-polyprenyl-6-hydroxyphenyl methylase / 3-demethylubiquinone-9 3-methyltransferase [Verrucomicrobiota bacterium]